MGSPSGPTADGLWRDRDFVRLWLAGGVSAVGARISREGLPLMAVLILHASPREIGLLAALRAAPALMVGPLCGQWVDHTRRRRILVVTDLARAVALLVIPAAAFAHHLVMGLVYAAAVAVGGLSSLFEMAEHAYLPSLVGTRVLVRANAALGGADAVAEVAGPAIAGVLFSVVSAPLAIVLNSLTYLGSAAFLSSIGREEPVPSGLETADDGRRRGPDPLGGLLTAWRGPEVRALLLMLTTSTLFGSFFAATYIPFAIRTLGLSPALLGATIAVGGLGGVAGAVLGPKLARAVGVGPALIAAGFASAGFTTLIPLAGGGPARAMAFLMAAQLFGDAAGTAVLIYSDSLRQSLLPGGLLGRVAGAFAAAAGLAAIVGALGGGLLAETAGVRGAMAVACAGLAAAPLWCVASPVRHRRAVAERPEDEPG